jgi:phospholipid transport system transporter-binding protein
MASDDDGELRLTGRLTVNEVPGVYSERLDWREHGPPERIDLSGLEASDSSAVALLLEWKRWARRAGRDIRFDDPPEALRTIAGLSQVDGLLGWKREDS